MFKSCTTEIRNALDFQGGPGAGEQVRTQRILFGMQSLGGVIDRSQADTRAAERGFDT